MENIKMRKYRGRVVWYALLIVLLFSGIVRFSLLNVPFERDEGEYAYAGQLILKGIPPYQEAYNMKLPGIYAAYALILAIFGQSHQAVHLALLIINAMTIIIVFLLAKQFMYPIFAVFSSACFSLLSISQFLQGIYANAEHFVIIFSACGLFLLIRALSESSLLKLFISGVLLGIGTTMKQHGFLFAVFALLYIILDTMLQRPAPWRRMQLRSLSFAGGVLSVLAGLFLIMFLTGMLNAFWFWTMRYAFAYISQITIEQALHNFLARSAVIIKSGPLLWNIAGFGLIAISTEKLSKSHRLFLIMFAIFSFLSICPGFYFRPHYFILMLPCVSVLSGLTVSALFNSLSGFSTAALRSGVTIILAAICLLEPIYKQRAFLFHMTPFQISRTTYWLNPFPESLVIADFIKERTEKEDRIAVFGSEPQIFFYAQRRSASSYIYMYPMMENHNFAIRMQEAFIKDIEDSNPKILIYVHVPTSWSRRSDSHKAIFQWLGEYLKKDEISMIGGIELFMDRAVYHWKPKMEWSPRSKYWITIFERSPSLDVTRIINHYRPKVSPP